MKKIIVTGCNGQLGRAINQVYADSREYECVNTDVAQLDITNIEAVMKLAEEVKPYAIINCAAHTNVNACETDVDNAYKINAIGPRNLSIAATRYNAKLVHISTDYVFSGDSKEPYLEFDQTGPKGIYGKTKLAGENFVKEFAKDHFIIRTAWLYGDGKNFVKTMLNLSQNHDTVRVVGDQIGSPTSATELAKAIAYLLPTDNYGLSMEPVKAIQAGLNLPKKSSDLQVRRQMLRQLQQKNIWQMLQESLHHVRHILFWRIIC